MACYVYVLVAEKGPPATYVGWTLDLARRLAEHNAPKGRGAKSTRGRSWLLVYAEKHPEKRAAMAREYALKRDRLLRAALRSAGLRLAPQPVSLAESRRRPTRPRKKSR